MGLIVCFSTHFVVMIVANFTGPEPSPGISVVNRGPTFIEVSWLPPQGNFDSFRFVYSTLEGPEEVFIPKNVLNYRINFLDPGETYPVMVYTRVELQESEAAISNPSTCE